MNTDKEAAGLVMRVAKTLQKMGAISPETAVPAVDVMMTLIRDGFDPWDVALCIGTGNARGSLCLTGGDDRMVYILPAALNILTKPWLN